MRAAALVGALMAATLTPAAAEIRIGVAGPMTGGDAAFGAEMRAGVEQAIADINAAGGVLAQQLAIVVADDGSDPKRGRSVAETFSAGGVRLVVGDFNSSVTLAASDVYAARNVLVITPGASNPQVTERGLATMFRICGRDDEQETVASAFLAARRDRRIAILHDRTSAGQARADRVRAQLAAAGMQEVFYDGVAKGGKDFGATLDRLETAAADFVYWGGGATEGALLVRQLRQRGRATQLLGSDALATEEFASLAGPSGDGTLMTFPREPRGQRAAADLVKRLAARNIAPDPYLIYAYAAVQAIKAGAEAARSLEPTAIAGALHAGAPVGSVLGDISFDAKGDARRPDAMIDVWRTGTDGRLDFYPPGS